MGRSQDSWRPWIATHGHAETLARFLREQGVDAGVMRTAWEDERGADEYE